MTATDLRSQLARLNRLIADRCVPTDEADAMVLDQLIADRKALQAQLAA